MIIRGMDVNLITGSMSSVVSEGNLGSDYDALRATVEAKLGHKFVPLSDDASLSASVEFIEKMTDAQVAALGSPGDEVVRVPAGHEIAYDFATEWFVPRPRVSFEEAVGETKAERVAAMVARGAPLAWASTMVDAEEGEYDAYDPLEGVHPYGTPIEDIFQAAIVAAERRAARRATA